MHHYLKCHSSPGIFKHFASKNQLPGLSIYGTLVENKLIYRQPIYFRQLSLWTSNIWHNIESWYILLETFNFSFFYSNWSKPQVLHDQYKTVLIHCKLFFKAKSKVVNYFCKTDVWQGPKYASGSWIVKKNYFSFERNSLLIGFIYFLISHRFTFV